MPGENAVSEATWAALERAAAYPGDREAGLGVESIQTHISRVFRTRGHVYKFRKSVRLPFLDFGTRRLRNEDCLREVALNRRLAEDVYLGVAPLLGEGEDARVGDVGEALAGRGESEHCVVMRRLPDGGDALSLLSDGKLGRRELGAAARVMADFHARHRLGPATLPPAEDWFAHCESPFLDSLALLEKTESAGIDAARVARARERTRQRLRELAAALEARRAAGCVVDGHGDLHLAHVWFEAGRADPLVIDCVEFDAELRRIDAASEVAFLSMDLSYRGRDDLAEAFLSAYADAADDYDLYVLVDWFAAYRAAVRAKVAGLAAGDLSIPPAQRERAARSASDHFALCERLLEPRRGARVAVMCGVIGSGKSTVAERLAEATGAVVLASDRIRRAPSQREAEARSGLPRYAPARVEAVYEAMLARAEPVAASGRPLILDATFGTRARRQRARAWARERGLEVLLIEVRCPERETLERLARRAAEGGSASEAGPELLAASLAAFERPEEWPNGTHRVLDGRVDFGPAAAEAAAWLRSEGDEP